MGAAENKEKVRRVVEEFVSNGNVAVTEEAWAADIILHDNFRLIEGIDSLREFVIAWRSACPDFHATINNLIGEGDYVALRYTLEGTFQNELYGMIPTSNEFKYVEHDLIQFREGKVVEIWAVCNELDLFQQLGVPLPTEENGK